MVPYALNVSVAVHPGGTSSTLLTFVAEHIIECLSSLPLTTFSTPKPPSTRTPAWSPAASLLWLCCSLTGLLLLLQVSSSLSLKGFRLHTVGQRLRVLWHPTASWPFLDIFFLEY